MKKVQWVCDQCPEGHPHVWQASVQKRSTGSDCPYCLGKAVCRHNSLAGTAPVVALDWDWEANAQTPHEFTAGSGARAHWRCHKCQHKWNTVIYARVVDGSKCPMCGPLRGNRARTNHPPLAKHGASVMQHWDWKMNAAAGLDPRKVTLGSSKKVHWICHNCPLGLKHRWIASPHQRFSPKPIRGCPYCTAKGGGKKICKCNALQTLYPDIAAEWDKSRNVGTPDDYGAFSTHLAWWTSAEQGTWQQTIETRTRSIRSKQLRQASLAS